jgi:hypothetical protein
MAMEKEVVQTIRRGEGRRHERRALVSWRPGTLILALAVGVTVAQAHDGPVTGIVRAVDAGVMTVTVQSTHGHDPRGRDSRRTGHEDCAIHTGREQPIRLRRAARHPGRPQAWVDGECHHDARG